jgi:PhnB protein
MTKLNPYLNFDGNALDAFNFYKSVFGGEFLGVMKMADAPGLDKLPENEKDRVMHVSLPIGENILMGSDILPSMGQKLNTGNNNYISINANSREEADQYFNGLSTGGKVEMPMSDQFWGDYFGSLVDKYDIHWMISHSNGNQ